MEKTQLYERLKQQLAALIEGERLPMPNLANAAALIGRALPDINWAGFYVVCGGELVLSSFCGAPACIRIPIGRGVCGTAAEKGATLIVPDVGLFDGHIACDPRSKSEIVVPLVRDGMVVAVLDVDSPVTDRFDSFDGEGLGALAALLAGGCDF